VLHHRVEIIAGKVVQDEAQLGERQMIKPAILMVNGLNGSW
jgi:hypothetical protein